MPTVLENKVNIAALSARDWNVILHNDDSVYAGRVVEAIMEVVAYSRNRASQIMLEAHQNGKASVIMTTEIAAYAYKEQLEDYGLTISVEKA